MRASRWLLRAVESPTTDEARTGIDRYVASLDPPGRRVAPGEWGVSLEVEGWPLHVGLRVRQGVLVAQAMAVGPGQLGAEMLLRANRRLDLVSFGLTESGEVWCNGAAPVAGLDDAEIDRLLALVVRCAAWARVQAR
jgi:Putative bacterial sensory transduction regulator